MKENFSWDNVEKAYLELIESLRIAFRIWTAATWRRSRNL